MQSFVNWVCFAYFSSPQRHLPSSLRDYGKAGREHRRKENLRHGFTRIIFVSRISHIVFRKNKNSPQRILIMNPDKQNREKVFEDLGF